MHLNKRQRDLFRGNAGVNKMAQALATINALSPAAWYHMRGSGVPTSSGGFASMWPDMADTDNGLVMPGVSGNYASAPDSVPLSITGDIDIAVLVAMSDWTPTIEQTLISKYSGVGNQRSWIFGVMPSGAIRLYQSLDGVAQTNNSSTAVITASGGDVLWVRVTREASSGTVKFYTGGSAASPTWVQLGADVTFASGDLFDSTALVQVGAWDGASTLSGNVSRAIIKNGIGGTTVFDADFSAQAKGTTSFTESSSNAATVTVNQSGALPAHIGNQKDLLQGTATNQPAYSAGVLTGDGVDNSMKANAIAEFVQPETVYIVGNPVSWTNTDRVFDGNAVSTGSMRQDTTTPQVDLSTIGGTTANNSDWAVGSFAVVCVVFNGAASYIRVNNNAKTGGSGTGTTAMGGFTLFAAGSNALFGNIAAKEVVIFLAAHDDATQDAVISALNTLNTVF